MQLHGGVVYWLQQLPATNRPDPADKVLVPLCLHEDGKAPVRGRGHPALSPELIDLNSSFLAKFALHFAV